MHWRTSECTNLNVDVVERSQAIWRYSWISKNGCYESPFAVTGGKAIAMPDTGSEEASKEN